LEELLRKKKAIAEAVAMLPLRKACRHQSWIENQPTFLAEVETFLL